MNRKRSPKTMVWWDCNKVLGGKKGPSKIALFLEPKPVIYHHEPVKGGGPSLAMSG